MKHTTIIVVFANAAVYLFIYFTLLQPIGYQHIKNNIIESETPAWKVYKQNKKWKGYKIRGYFCLFKILYYTSNNPDSIYKNIEKNIKKTEIHKNIKFFNNGIIGINKKGIGKKGYKVLTSFSFKNRVFWLGMYTSSTSKKYFNAFIHFLQSLKIEGTNINPDAISQLKLFAQKIPLSIMQDDKFINMSLIFLFIAIPLIMIIKIFFDGRLPFSTPEGMVKQEGYVDIFINYKKRKTEAFTGSIILTQDMLFLFKNRKVLKKIALNQIQRKRKYLIYKDESGKIIQILPKDITNYKSFIAI